MPLIEHIPRILPERNSPTVANLARGWFNGVRTGFLVVVALSMAPIVIFASALAAQQAGAARGWGDFAAWGTAAVLPLALGFGGCFAISLATEAWILRWLRYFERIARVYAKGRYNLRPYRVGGAPVEFRSLGVAVGEMAVAVESRDAALRTALDEQTMLLREVHHRVKNNLQVVSSLLSLQASRADDPNVKDAILDALVRLDAMSVAERFALEEEQAGPISTASLFAEWANQVRARLGAGHRRVRLEVETTDQPLAMGVAGPLLLIATETLMQAYRGCDLNPLPFTLKLKCSEGGALVTMSLRIAGAPDPGEDAPGISPRLIDAYIRQIKGRITSDCARSGLVVEAPLPVAA